MIRNGAPWMTRCLAPVVLLAALVAWSAPAPAAEDGGTSRAPVLSEADMADLRALDAEVAIGVPHRLDLGNPLHYRVTMAALRRGGETPERSPYLFQSLRETHERRAARLEAAGTPAPQATLAAVVAETGTPQDLNFIATFSEDNAAAALAMARGEDDAPVGYQATGISSVVNGTTTTSIVMELYEADSGHVYATQSETQYGQGTDFRVQVEGQVPPDAGSPTTRAQGLFVYYPKSSAAAAADTEPVVYVQTFQDTLNPTQACMEQPNYCVRNNAGQCTGSYETSCTNTKANETPIKICWYRGSQQECDYWNSTSHPTDFVFPLSGSVSYPNTVVSPPAGVVTIYIQNPNGGGCNVYYKQGEVLDPQYWTVDDKQISWNYPAAAFPNNRDCIQYYDATTAYLWVTAYVALNGSGGGEPPPFGTINFTSDRSQIGVPGVSIVPPLTILQGCLAAGTPIALADGGERPVEAFTANQQERVKTAHGQTRLVRGTTQGREPHPMLRIQTDAGHDVLMTRTHPVILAEGVPVQARALRVGDRVTTLEGSATVTAIAPETYEGVVHNLTVEEGGRAGTFFAGGILTGDAVMQQSLTTIANRTLARSPAQIRESLPEVWHQDFDNHQ
ncbi:Hint domain-containing protein [Roseospira goensis]|uniref:Hint domain-containing protein n=1 Tax=Roseospira goensis TaxID=391922 RepID=A0A7W6RWM8_9PROT|nr:Hint domain-containing protein [Roseospira goensis]MBB4284585.1 hypothetical protein [Roseospira goensis]